MAALQLLISFKALAQIEPAALQPPAYLAETQSWTMTSALSGRTYQISVALPDRYDPNAEPYRVLYAVDANTEFGTLVETARNMAWQKTIPDLVIVGIGYPVGMGWRGIVTPRTVDLTPTDDPAWIRSMDPEHEALGIPPLERGGGAGAFLSFIRSELAPLIEGRYHVDGNSRGLYGHSFGGLFGVHSLFQEIPVFRAFIIGSPSLWWDDEVSFRFEQEYFERTRDLRARVFLAVGTLEENAEELAPYAMVANLRRFVDVVRSRAYSGLELDAQVFEDETHLSVVPATISRGLRFIYGS